MDECLDITSLVLKLKHNNVALHDPERICKVLEEKPWQDAALHRQGQGRSRGSGGLCRGSKLCLGLG